MLYQRLIQNLCGCAENMNYGIQERTSILVRFLMVTKIPPANLNLPTKLQTNVYIVTIPETSCPSSMISVIIKSV